MKRYFNNIQRMRKKAKKNFKFGAKQPSVKKLSVLGKKSVFEQHIAPQKQKSRNINNFLFQK